MSATPHNGKEADFQLFMGLLDADRFEGRFREGIHKADVSDMMRRLIKEELYHFDGTPLFPERRAYTASYSLSPAEADLYQAVTTYVREEMNRADRVGEPTTPRQPRRFYGSVDIDMGRPVKAFDAILNAVVLELQRSPNAKVKITLEIEAETPSGFSEADIGVVRDNARQLRFKPEFDRFRIMRRSVTSCGFRWWDRRSGVGSLGLFEEPRPTAGRRGCGQVSDRGADPAAPQATGVERALLCRWHADRGIGFDEYLQAERAARWWNDLTSLRSPGTGRRRFRK